MFFNNIQEVQLGLGPREDQVWNSLKIIAILNINFQTLLKRKFGMKFEMY